MINYIIRHPHQTAKQREQALNDLENVIEALEIKLPIPEAGGKATVKRVEGWYEAIVIHSKQSVSAVIHTYNRPAYPIDGQWLDISESPDRNDAIDWL